MVNERTKAGALPRLFQIMKRISFLALLLVCTSISFSQRATIFFAHISDTHIGGNTAAEDLRRTVKDINENDSIQFVVITGDITEFGSDEEIILAKQILDSLTKKWYIIPGNHDSNWSESGSNTFKKIFGSETFAFTAAPYLFLGTHSGPNMRMSPGQIPRENIVWLDSILKITPDETPIIFLNHYPMDSSLNNWYEVVDRLKQKNIQLFLCGHGHTNKVFDVEGISSIMGRSNLRAKDETGAYNLVTIQDKKVSYRQRTPGKETGNAWASIRLQDHLPDKNQSINYPRPSYAVNQVYKSVQPVWSFQGNSDIGSGTAVDNKNIYTTNTDGEIIALQIKDGKVAWRFTTNGKIYASPVVADGILVTASSDSYIYGLMANTGQLIWKVKTNKAVLGNPVIKNGIAYIGGSDGSFRAVDIKTGQEKWSFTGVTGFIVTTPYIYAHKIYFGCWNNDFYCLDLTTGQLIWKWNNGSSNRMLSPAAVFPVVTNNRVFIVAPDRYMTCLDAHTGKVIWRKSNPAMRVRESMGLSKDSSKIYVKTMEGNVYGLSTVVNDMTPTWKSDVELGYEISPTAIVENNNHIVFVPTQSGTVVALESNTGKLKWKHKVSNALVTSLLPLDNNRIIIATMDGKIVLLQFS